MSEARHEDTKARRHGGSRRPAAGFTVVEILIVIGVVVLLLSILIVAMNKAVQAAQAANTRALMTSMRQALVQFESDVGYYPPVLNAGRGLVLPPDPDSNGYPASVQTWFSVTAPADFLLGYGNAQEDGCGQAADPTVPALGIRDPGRDGVWGATVFGNGELAARNSGAGAAVEGQVLGPYLELKDDRLLAAINPAGSIVFPGEDSAFDTYPKVIVDYWGTPIRYYRRVYPAGALSQDYRAVDRDGDGISDRVPTMSDYHVLRPFFVEPGAEVDVPAALADAVGDTTTSIAINAADFALLSAGPDKTIDQTARVDAAEFNRDNVVEVGP